MTAGGNSFRNATAHKLNSYYTLAISYCTFCVGKHTILGPVKLEQTTVRNSLHLAQSVSKVRRL